MPLTPVQPESSRRKELSRRLGELRARVADAAAAAGRDPQEITVIAVTKAWPASDVVLLQSLGARDIGENRAQELAAKIAELDAHLRPHPRWHFIGQLQRNKAPLVARHCAALHTLDRVELIAPLQRSALARGRDLDVFLQLSFDGDPARGGVTASGIQALADAVGAADRLRLCGLMAVAPLGAPPRRAFAQLRALSERLRATHPSATAISAGMSGDLEDAVIEGATHLRVGTDLLGSRA